MLRQFTIPPDLIMNLTFIKKEGPGKCSKCGIHLDKDAEMFVATNLAGRPSLTKDQLVMVDPEFCQKCHGVIAQ